MNILQWAPDMALGVPSIDSAHQRLLRRLGHLACAQDTHFPTHFEALIQLFESNFRDEEALMAEIAFPELEQHRRQHQKLLAALGQCLPDAAHGQLHTCRELVDLLPHWFLAHLSTMDLTLAVALDMAHAGVQGQRSH